ncbi:MAG: hypothetical protein VW338_16725 [Rhodospirillaceae bacterium]
MKWFERALDAGHAPAAYNLGVLYRDGRGAAQNRIAIMLAKSEGAKRDPETALMWFHVAAGLGAFNPCL